MHSHWPFRWRRLLAAVAVPLFAGATEPIDLEQTADLTILAVVVGLVALAALVEVVGHEMVGYRHTLRVLGREDLRRAGAHALAYSSSSAVSSGRSRTVTAIPYGRNRTLRVLSTLCLFARRASSSVAYTCSICAPPPSFTV